MKLFILAFVALLGVSDDAAAINKCLGSDGKTVFQDAPCTGAGETIIVKPARGASIPPSTATTPSASGATADASSMTEVQRIESKIAKSQKDRRKIDLEARFVPDSYQAIGIHRAQCEAELRSLQSKKRLASNNLAGATWEGSISSEMSAIATRCDTRNRELMADYERFRAECRELGGCR